jgi:hypothetical protein
LTATAIVLLLTAGRASLAAQEKQVMVTVKPTETQELLANPGMGWQTFHRFADEDQNLAGIPSGAAYFRFYWKDLEPVEGQIDFAKLDALLAHAHRAGQKLGFRVMTAGTSEYFASPQWLKDKGCRGVEYSYEGRGKFWAPDLEDPVVKEAHTRLLRELGKRFDGHPDLDYIDIGSVGLWGEWHMSGTQVIPTGEEAKLPSQQRRLEIIREYLQCFPRTPKLMLIGDQEGMRYATGQGCGWRADCLGDMGGFSCTWNHMQNMYPQQIERTGAGEAWRKGPVAWESCWDMRKWVDSAWDVRFIFDYGLGFHASYMNNKSAPIPDGMKTEVERFVRRLGYRLVLRSLEHPASVEPGARARLALEWENVGVAPPYRGYLVAFRLRAGGQEIVLVTDRSVRGWLPGKIAMAVEPVVPRSAQPGRYELAVGVVDPATKEPAVRLAIVGRSPDGWYPMSEIQVRRRPGPAGRGE